MKYNLLTGKPDKKQLQRLNELRPFGTEEYTSENVQVASALSADNLINMNYAKWTKETLKVFAKAYTGGEDLLLNHADYDIKERRGVIIDSIFMDISSPSSEQLKLILKNSRNRKKDLEIIKEEGYQALILTFGIKKDPSEGIEGVDVSIAGNGSIEHICPKCEEDYLSESCPHVFMANEAMAKSYDRSLKDESVIQYYKKEIKEFVTKELSLVVAGNCQRARVITQEDYDILISSLNS